MTRFFSILSALFFLFASSTFAGDMCAGPGSSDNIVCPEFTINLGNLDPVHPDGTTVPVGIEAATTLLDKIAGLLLFVMPLIAGVALIIAGYYYVLSSGDSEKASKAKMIIKWNALAIAIALLSFVIIKGIAALLEGAI